eukprot:3688439-Pleurochrysis_carterae.AAC.1
MESEHPDRRANKMPLRVEVGPLDDQERVRRARGVVEQRDRDGCEACIAHVAPPWAADTAAPSTTRLVARLLKARSCDFSICVPLDFGHELLRANSPHIRVVRVALLFHEDKLVQRRARGNGFVSWTADARALSIRFLVGCGRGFGRLARG